MPEVYGKSAMPDQPLSGKVAIITPPLPHRPAEQGMSCVR